MGRNLEAMYSEGSNSVRHYSGLILSLKNTTIAQGFALLAGQGYFFQTREYAWSLLVGCFGVLFTLTLNLIGRGLMGHFNVLVDTVQRIERELSSEYESLGPWTTFESSSIRHRGHSVIRPITLHGHIVLLLIAFLCIIAYDIVMLLRGWI